jgi:hypothetical protein
MPAGPQLNGKGFTFLGGSSLEKKGKILTTKRKGLFIYKRKEKGGGFPPLLPLSSIYKKASFSPIVKAP